jgi:cellulose synthase/poly-beta-1,6-N-acetylglucosamine synthase-like glycosyltransferase
MLDYFFHKFDTNNFRLVMTILVRDEADIIEANIRTHASLGVDAFVIMDNGSIDGTREILSKLVKEFEIIVIDEKGDYNQAKWMKQLAMIIITFFIYNYYLKLFY